MKGSQFDIPNPKSKIKYKVMYHQKLVRRKQIMSNSACGIVSDFEDL
jgi:hypothetical protein